MKMRVGIIGLGSMGIGMACNLLRAGIPVKGYDISDGAREAFTDAGGVWVDSSAAVADDVDVLILMIVNAEQATSVLFGSGDAIAAIKPGATVMFCSTAAPSDVREIAAKVAEAGCNFLDAPVSGGKTGADAGTLTIMAAGNDEAFLASEPVLRAISEKVHHVSTEPGMGATYKVVHQLAAGVHLVAAAELMALGRQVGCDAKLLFDIVSTSSGQSWIFNDRVPHMLDGDFAPRSMVDIFVKDMGLVLQTGRDVSAPLPLSAVAHQMFLAASALGHGQLDDSAVVKAYEVLTGCSVHKKRAAE